MAERAAPTLTESRVLSLVQGSYGTESPQDLRQIDDGEFMKRLKEEAHHRSLPYAYRQIQCNGLKDDQASNYVTLQTSPSSDGVEFVTLDDYFVADPSTVYEQIIPAHSPNLQTQNEAQNGLASYLPQSELQNGGCIIQLEPVMPNHLSVNSYVSLPPEQQMSYDQSVHDSKVQYMEASQSDADQSRQQSSAIIPNHPVPIQVVRPQQHLKNRSKSVSCSEDLRFIGTRTHGTPSPPNQISASTRKRGTRTASLGSSSDDGSLMNLSMSSNEGKEHSEDENGKHRRSKQPVPEMNKDEKYWRRREKNNLAAKRSREARKQKENQTTERAAFLEEQYSILKKTLEEYQRQNEELRRRLSKYENAEELQKIC